MYPDERVGKVRIKKGYMTFTDLLTSLENMDDTFSKPMVLHFRIGTQGNNNHANTHPFPISDSDKLLGLRRSTVDVGLVHNGIIPLTCRAGGDVSDTHIFVRDYASRICDTPDYYNSTNKIELLEQLAESKLCIMSNDGHVELIGKFVHEGDDGCYYSNMSYLIPTYGKYTYSSNGQSSTDYSGYGAWIDYDSDTDGYIDASGVFIPFDETQMREDADANQYEKVTAQFVEDGCVLYNSAQTHRPDKGIMSADDDTYLVDLFGQAYLWDDEHNGLILLPNCEVFTNEWVPVRAELRASMQFNLLG
jgi:hypothetical protein